MNTLALVTDAISLQIDYDMPLLLDACQENGLIARVCEWEDQDVDWSSFDAVLLRSPWNCIDRLPAFLGWCEKVDAITHLLNPLSAVRWGLDKIYLNDLASYGVPTIPSKFIGLGDSPVTTLRKFLIENVHVSEVVVKPTVGSYSRGVQRFKRRMESEATEHIAKLLNNGTDVILQPYLESVDCNGETNLTYFDGKYSHAIRKSAMLMPDGNVNVPTFEFRKACVAEEDERHLAAAALGAATSYLGIKRPLLYGRVDVVRDSSGSPMVLELEICEPSLNLPYSDCAAALLVQALTQRLENLS
jgi:O-ureido-D-serine cyclo-ligase